VNTVNLGNPELLGIAAVLGALRWLVPAISHEYRKHIDWRDKRKRRQVREISTVSPTTGTITKRSA
jgi:hypothetical protein